jgi:hypothetical protein
MLPSDFPKWESVYFYFTQWNEPKGDTGKPFTDTMNELLGTTIEIADKILNLKAKKV